MCWHTGSGDIETGYRCGDNNLNFDAGWERIIYRRHDGLPENVDPSQSFSDALASTTMSMTWDGTSYWSCSGGSGSGVRLAQYAADGTVTNTYSPGIDFRSVFTKAPAVGPVFARGHSSNQIRVQTSPGVFGNDVLLSGGTLNSQSSVVFDFNRNLFVAMNNGTVTRWAADGSLVDTVTLEGFGSLGTESSYPQNRGIAVTDSGLYLTYDSGTLSVWSAAGQRLGTTNLNSVGADYNSNFSLSYANGLVWVVDTAGGTWYGFDIGL
jgi:hypothetical protein